MNRAVAVCSLLHEEIDGSASRQFRGRSVLAWTIDRLSASRALGDITVLCWDDQRPMVQSILDDSQIISRGRRAPSLSMQAIMAARRWSDGWRGGLLQTCDFDAGFDANAILGLLAERDADLAMLVDPSAALIDSRIADALIARAIEKTDEQMFIAPAAVGFAPVLLRRSLIEKLAAVKIHPGKLLHYLPDQPMRDPIAGDGCIDLAVIVKRSSHSFRFDSARQIERLTASMQPLNGQLRTADAATIVAMRSQGESIDRLPREVVLELNTNRQSRAIFRHPGVRREAMTAERAQILLDDLSASPDVRLTIAGAGDPLESDVLFDVIEMAKSRGIQAIQIETDLLGNEETVARLGRSGVDVVTVHLPAMSAAMYAKLMGIDALPLVLNSIATLLKARVASGSGVPILVPTFTKCRENLGEMESWYDQWIRALGCAVIVGANDFCGQITDVSVANMMPSRRRPCRRIQTRLSVLCDGSVIVCEQDIAGRGVIGRIGEQPLSDIWMRAMEPVRSSHARGEWSAAHPLCGSCAEWNRP
jgi:hypothetical protein